MNGFVLKCVAVVTMLIDHMGAVLFPQYIWMRMVGRIAFPIYCFLLIEGYSHTRSVKKYLTRLGIFALVSEVPFNLAFSRAVTAKGTNVFFTLFLGLLAVWLCDYIKSVYSKYSVLGYGAFIAAGVIAGFLYTDYSYYGIALIFVFYEFKNRKVLTVVLSGIVFLMLGIIEMCALASFIPIFCYNGERGPNHKVLSIGFYVFYPVHLLVLYGILWLRILI